MDAGEQRWGGLHHVPRPPRSDAERETVTDQDLGLGEFLNTRKRGKNLPNLFYLNYMALQKIKDSTEAGSPQVISL